ncbi:hypothetical protein ACQP1G_20765 [Nocardia sp. CA-107356]|uniref:hypothetical protein n=1 Tax=Nocardia sp. CA-107356 TaxID=3239972 RepID=UPI003D904A5E
MLDPTTTAALPPPSPAQDTVPATARQTRPATACRCHRRVLEPRSEHHHPSPRPDETRWQTVTSEYAAATRWVYTGPEDYHGVLTTDSNGHHRGTIHSPGGGPGPLTDDLLSPVLDESKLAVEGMIALEIGAHNGRALVWRRLGPDPRIDAAEVHHYEGPFDFSAVIDVGIDGVIRLTVFGRREPICHNEPVDSVAIGKADALAVIRTHIGSATQLETYTSTTIHPGSQPKATAHDGRTE